MSIDLRQMSDKINILVNETKSNLKTNTDK